MNFLTNILTVAKQIGDDRAKAMAVAAQAGSRSTYAPPLNVLERENRYWAQNGVRRLTPRQRRRVEHKANLAAKRAALT